MTKTLNTITCPICQTNALIYGEEDTKLIGWQKLIPMLQVPSTSEKDVVYDIGINLATGGLYCTCPGNLYHRHCKHIDKLSKRQIAQMLGWKDIMEQSGWRNQFPTNTVVLVNLLQTISTLLSKLVEKEELIES